MKIGDRVRIFDNLHPKYAIWVRQSGGGEGKIVDARGLWVDVMWDSGHFNSYPLRVLEVLWDGPLPDPEFDLEEINQGSELYRKLEGR